VVSSARKRTLIIESQTLFVRALEECLALEPVIEIVGIAATITESLVRSGRPDLVIIDIDSEGIDLAAMAQVCRALSQHVRVCALSMHYRTDLARSCFDAGIDGYLMKDVTPNEFRQSIRSIALGQRIGTQPPVDEALPQRANEGRPTKRETLSPREVEVVRLLAVGLSNKAIGAALFVSEKTIKNHVSRIFMKLNVTARTQAAMYALQSGLIETLEISGSLGGGEPLCRPGKCEAGPF
jgi:NarL family two-component system response regulator LiaR